MTLFESNLPKMNKKEVREVKEVLNNVNKTKSSKCPDEKDIQKWTTKDLKDYITIKTKGMSVSKRFKFAAELDKKIKEARKLKQMKGGMK